MILVNGGPVGLITVRQILRGSGEADRRDPTLWMESKVLRPRQQVRLRPAPGQPVELELELSRHPRCSDFGEDFYVQSWFILQKETENDRWDGEFRISVREHPPRMRKRLKREETKRPKDQEKGEFLIHA